MTAKEIELYLPKHLSVKSHKGLIEALSSFPDIPADKYYTTTLRESKEIFQGDGLKNLIIVDLPSLRTKKKEAMVFSNTCDIYPDNPRFIPLNITYAPIIKLQDYIQVLEEEGVTEEKINSQCVAIRKQHITHIFFLPAFSDVIDDSIVLLDRMFNMPTSEVDLKDIKSQRLFTLSDAGHYLFLFKLSYHFTRMQDGVERGFEID